MAAEWYPSEISRNEYNKAGQVTSSTTESYRTVYEYDAMGRCTVLTQYGSNDGDFTPEYKTEYTYDNIVTNLITEERGYNYQDGNWVLNESSRTLITRNTDNNITRIQQQASSIYYDTPGWHDEALVEIGYGSDKKANTIKVYEYEEERAQLQAELVDIVWDQTDGQIVFFEMDEAEFFLGTNRISSAKAPAATNYPYAGDIFYTVTYKADNDGFNMTATMNGATFMSQDYTVLDSYGSFTSEEFEVDYDHMDDGSYQPDDPMLDVYTEIYDAYGLQLKNSEISYTDGNKANGISYQNEMTAKVTYDSTHGYPLEYISRRSYDGQAPEYADRIVYSDYYDVIEAGVTDTVISDSAPVEYYNLLGIRVENPTPGLYIRRQGNTVAKVLVK